jgi:hypothetical protein
MLISALLLLLSTAAAFTVLRRIPAPGDMSP